MPIGVTVIASGSNGNCCVIHAGDQAILIDCGISLRKLRQRLHQSGIAESAIKAILITHEHSDHVSGLAGARSAFGVPVFATRLTAEAIRQQRPDEGSFTLIQPCNDFPLGEFTIHAFPLQHDAVDTVGYVVTHGSVKVGVATDFGAATQMVKFQLRGCSTLVAESNYDLNMLAASARPWSLKQRILGPSGHLSNPDNAMLLDSVVTAETRNLVLAHISQDCNQYDLALRTAADKLAALQRQDIFLTCGRRDQPTPTVWC